jgi:hypothetical protein
MTQRKTYTLIPLSGDVGRQEVWGFREAFAIARDIASRGHDVIVRNEADALSWTVDAETKCPNCIKEHGVEDVCFIGMLLGVVSDRLDRELTPADIEHVMRNVSPDYLWDDFGGPAADYIESLLPTEEG